MIAAAAIDVLDGAAVQLVEGDPSVVPIREPDPDAVARAWIERGFRRLHVIDLDAALGRGHNRRAIASILRNATVPVQVGGGIRSRADVERWLDAGADRVIVGTRAVRDPDWAIALSATFPGRIVVAADVKSGEVVTHGWTAGSGRPLPEQLALYGDAGLAAVLVTDVDREGRQQGCDAALFEAAVRASDHPILAAGGIAAADDLARLERAGVAEAVLGMALYTGKIPVADIQSWVGDPSHDDNGVSS